MLKHLSIHHYALISELEIDFSEGFSVMTGETGAGKSIILGALSLLMGSRADTKSISEGQQKCVIEGAFCLKGYGLEAFFEQEGLDYSDECVIRRELTTTGKSRSFINDTPVTLQQLKPLSTRLIDIHSQHQNLLLSDEMFCLDIVDSLADNEQQKAAYLQTFRVYQDKHAALEKMKREASQMQQNADFIAYQYEQLESANLREEELEELEQLQQRLANAETIQEGYAMAIHYLRPDDATEQQGAIDQIRQAYQSLSRISEFLPEGEQLIERLESAAIELEDIVDSCEHQLSNTDANPQKLEEIETRISELHTLLRKFGKDNIHELILLQESYAEQLSRSDSYDFEIQQLEEQTKAAFAALQAAADKLTASRNKVAPKMKKSLEERLKKLGVTHAAIELQINALDTYEEHGHDNAVILFAANKNQSLRNVSEIASGGEMARLMLSIKALIADTQGLPTIIFDEVDTGVSGEVANEMGSVMQEMATGRQIISITHLPQIAAKGNRHYKVYKQDTELRTETHIRCLSSEERVQEIAMLLSGAAITPEAISAAKALLHSES